jgi:uncharacterized Fe-S cluster-containing protein
LEREFLGKKVNKPVYSEEQIREVLRKTGKMTPEDERNCEGCGYKNCRSKAVAVLNGLAVPEMCVPYMRAKAESFASAIVDNTPNGVIVLNENMEVLDYNPAAVKMFSGIPLTKGLNLGTYMDTCNFEKVLRKGTTLKEVKVCYRQWGMVTRQVIAAFEQKKLVMVLFTDITEVEERQIQMQVMKEDVIQKAREVINKQMTVAQTIAGLLGETTAETKATLVELLKHMESD